MSGPAFREVLAVAVGHGLTWANPCGCAVWMDGTHTLYWRIPKNEFHGVTECMYCGATWGVFDAHQDELARPPWQRPEPDKPSSLSPGITIPVSVSSPLGPCVA